MDFVSILLKYGRGGDIGLTLTARLKIISGDMLLFEVLSPAGDLQCYNPFCMSILGNSIKTHFALF